MSAASDDYDLFASSILAFVKLVMTLESNDIFPTYDQVRDLIQDEEKMKNFSATVPQQDGALCIPSANKEACGTFSCSAPPSSFETNYDANNAVVDVPMKLDLASDRTLEILLNYSESLADNALNEKNNEEEDFEPVMATLSPYLLGDGNPIWGIYKHMRKTGSKYKRQMPAYFGGFHLVLETHKKRRTLFGDSHLCDVFRRWRKTDKMLEWVMDPGDPSQVNDEMMMMHLGK